MDLKQNLVASYSRHVDPLYIVAVDGCRSVNYLCIRNGGSSVEVQDVGNRFVDRDPVLGWVVLYGMLIVRHVFREFVFFYKTNLVLLTKQQIRMLELAVEILCK